MKKFSKVSQSLFLLAFAAIAAACGGRSLAPAGSAMPAAADAGRVPAARAPDGSATTAPLIFTLPAIKPPSAPVIWAKRPNLLSAATRSLFASIGGQNFGPIPLTATSPGCAQTRAGTVCTVTMSAPVGQSETLSVATYPGSVQTGTPLAVATAPQNVYAGQKNYAAPNLIGIALSIAMEPQPTTVKSGLWSGVELVAYGVDSAGRLIPSVYGQTQTGEPIQNIHMYITEAGWLNVNIRSPLRCCGIVSPFIYNGIAQGSETFTPSYDGTTGHSGKLTVVPGSEKSATLIIEAATVPPFATTVQYAAGANGDVEPLRDMPLTPAPQASAGNCLCEDLAGNFWIGATEFSNLGNQIGTLSVASSLSAIDSNGNLYGAVLPEGSSVCTIYKYPPGTGSPAPIREIDIPGCQGGHGPIPVALDRSGNVFAGVGNQIFEYSPHSGSGFVHPIRTVATPGTGFSVAWLDVDAAGNLYALYQGTALYEFAPGATTPKQLLNQAGPYAFAVDDAGDVFAAFFELGLGGTVEEFAPGASAPKRVISGDRLRFREPYGTLIAVPRTR